MPSRSTLLALIVVVAVLVSLPATAVPVSGASPEGKPVVPDAFELSGDALPHTQVPSTPSSNLPIGNDTAVRPQLLELYPNPVAHGNPGEFVVVHFPKPTNVSGWYVKDDGRQSATLPDETVEGTVAFSIEPEKAAQHTDHDVYPLSGWFDLAVDGERVILRTSDDVVVDATSYDRAPEAERYERTRDGWEWRPLGATDFEPRTARPEAATAFVFPDADDEIERQLHAADERILLAGYTLTSEAVVDALLEAHRRDVEVAVLVDGSPVGGTSERQVAALDRLVDAGIEVTVLGGDHARYRFHHAKYAVVDDGVVVLTENWKPSGTGGASSRGWGVAVADPVLAAELAAVFRADDGWRDGIPWEQYRKSVEPVEAEPADGEYPEEFAPEEVPVERVDLLVAPDNAEEELVELFAGAEQSIRIKQVRIGDREFPLLVAVIEAARRGAEVEILLSSAWYVEAENRELVRALDELAAEEDLDISAELVDPRSRFEKVHAKGAIVDDRHVVLGSLNWNRVSLRDNREVVVVLTGEEVADYYLRAFRADSRGGAWRLPLGVAGATTVAWLGVSGVLARRIDWDSSQR